MLRYIVQRLLWALPTLLGVITMVFLLIHLVPGDPVDAMLGEQAQTTEEDRTALRRELGLDKPLLQQYADYLSNLVQLDLGRSIISRAPIAEEIFKRFPATFELSITALFMALLWGIPLGVVSAVFQYSLKDYIGMSIGLLCMSVPGAFLGPLLIYIFAIQLDWLPVSERAGMDHLLLPALSLAIPLGAVILRMTRASVLEVIREDYIRTARSKGVPEWQIYFRHALRNALIPIVTIVGLQLGALLTGTVITETIFDWPGIGSLLYQGIQRRDYPMVQGCVLLVASTYVLVNLLTDLAYGVVNPRVRLGNL